MSQVQKHETISVVWSILISPMKGRGLTPPQFQSPALTWCVKWWPWALLPWWRKDRWHGSVLCLWTSVGPAHLQADYVPLLPNAAVPIDVSLATRAWISESVWITGTMLLPPCALAMFLLEGPKLVSRRLSSMNLPYWNNDMFSYLKTKIKPVHFTQQERHLCSVET